MSSFLGGLLHSGLTKYSIPYRLVSSAVPSVNSTTRQSFDNEMTVSVSTHKHFITSYNYNSMYSKNILK